MSLHKFAEQVASQGRGDDSLLVHMTPDEVRNLQRFAQANGTTLTINPTTGLPEAGLLSDLFKSIAPIALGAFLGPAGFGLSSAMAGVATGGITALATGSLSRGLMAGLGAYGGAGLGASLMGAGESALGANLGTSLTDTQAQSLGFQNAGTAAQTNAMATAPMERLTAGFNAATASPTAAMDFAKANYKPLLAAAAPIMAGAMVPTTTQLPDPKSTGNIRQMTFNINPDTGKPDPLYGLREMPVVKASEFGNKTFQGQRDLFHQQNPNPYELGVGSLNQPPKPMATGGIVALAGGGDAALAAYQAGDYATANRLLGEAGMSAQDVVSKYGLDQAQAADVAKNLGYAGDMGGIKYGTGYVEPAATPTYTQYTPEQIGSYLTTNPNADIAAATKTTNADPAAVNAYLASIADPFKGSTDTTGGSGVLGIYNQMKAQGIDPNELYAAEIANDPKYAGYTQPMIQKAYDLSKGAYSLSDQLKGNVSDKDWVKFMDDNKYSIDDAAQAFGLSRNEVKSRYDAVKNAEKVVTPITTITGATGNDVIKPDPFKSVVPDGYYGSGPATGVDYNGNTVSIATPGDIITNPDGTRTVVPNIPGRPDGGFTGMEQVKSAYTAGGGSLGYTAKAPRTMDEFNRLYNRQTGDSLAAYDYLMGKGGGKYPVKSGVPKISENYADFVLGRKATRPTRTTTDKVTTVVGTPGNAQSYFDEKAYLAANPDVAEELRTGKSVSGQPVRYTSGYEHYLMYGKAAGRPFAGDYEGYTTAAALANAAGAGGGDAGPSGPSGTTSTVGLSSNEANSITGLAAAPNNSISVTDAVSSPATSGDDGDDGDDGGEDAVGGYYSRGKLNYRSKNMAAGGYAMGGGIGSLGSYSDGGRLLKGPGDGVSDSIPATIGAKQQPARLADGEFVIPARIVSELGNGSTDAGAKKLYAMMDRVQKARGKTTGKNKVAANSRSDKYLPA